MKKEKYPVARIGRLRMGTDGHGIRTLVFFQQCFLRCKYCINPFTWNGSEKPSMMTAQEIYDSVLIDRPYLIASNGGVTFGGGEPLLQSRAIREFSEINEDGFSIHLETSLNVPREKLLQVIEVADMYYVDIKTTNDKIYKEYTGGDLQVALSNLKVLLEKVGPQKILVRIPIIPGMTDKKQQEQSLEYLKTLGVTLFDLFTYQVV